MRPRKVEVDKSVDSNKRAAIILWRILILDCRCLSLKVYDTTIETPRIEFEYMLWMLQQSIYDKDNQWAFMLRAYVKLWMYLLL